MNYDELVENEYSPMEIYQSNKDYYQLGLKMFVENYHSEYRTEDEDRWISYVYDLCGLKMALGVIGIV